MNPSQITDWCHQIIRSVAKKDGLYIDATMGKGHDTKLLCELAGEQGSVLAFDIQSEAVHAMRPRGCAELRGVFQSFSPRADALAAVCARGHA